MFGIGTWEIIVILVLALVLLGPAKLPEVARSVGRGLAKMRRAADDVKREIQLDELGQELRQDPDIAELRSALDLRGEIRRAMTQLEDPAPLPGPEQNDRPAPAPPERPDPESNRGEDGAG